MEEDSIEHINKMYNTVIKINEQKLIEHLTCPLCKGIYRTPYTINECMHTYCKSCIFNYFYSNPSLSKCPTCNIILGGKPLETLIFDNSINAIIEILFPEFDTLDREAQVNLFLL